MSFKTILYEKEAETALITFNRPEKRNALNEQMMDELDVALYEAEADQSVSAIVITGGSKYFISGTDIDFLQGEGSTLTPQRMYELHYTTQRVYRHLSLTPKPTLAAMAGYALGGGLELALCCDFRIAGENTKIGNPEIKLGIIPGAGGTQRLTRMIGITKAKEIVLTGEIILAKDAYQLGLLTKVVPVDDLLKEAIAFSNKFQALPKFAVAIGKAVMDTGSNIGLREALEVERMGFSMLYSTEDQKEGLQAFLEKRPPRFSGK
jgi:enoyl-CoA hydratase